MSTGSEYHSDGLRALRDEIFATRQELAASALAASHLSDARNLAISRRLDRLVVAYMRRVRGRT